jgi:transposase
MQTPSTIDIDPVISLAIELSASTWLAASKIPASEKTGLHRTEAGDCQALLALIADVRKKVAANLGVEAAVVSRFEAGRDGFWLHRLLSEHGAREAIDGHLRDGAEVLMIDDVATRGARS